jgi:hypothetical protein
MPWIHRARPCRTNSTWSYERYQCLDSITDAGDHGEQIIIGLVYDSTHSSPRLRFFGTLVSAVSIPSVSSDGTKLGLERSTSKMTSGSAATRASARGQTPRDESLSFGARIKARKQFRSPNVPFPASNRPRI